jgi:hypothetical protein
VPEPDPEELQLLKEMPQWQSVVEMFERDLCELHDKLSAVGYTKDELMILNALASQASRYLTWARAPEDVT